jgi:DNA-binding transcriptional ArsR family regulator
MVPKGKIMASPELTRIISFFKVLSDESRLKIVGALSSSEHSVDELAELLGLRAPTVSHHLTKLKEVSLVSMRPQGTTHVYKLNLDELRAVSKRFLALDTMSVISQEVELEAWERKVMRDFFEGERLKEIPASRKKREVILRFLADQFENDKQYPEKEVNRIIGRHHPDFATLRRELIGAQLLKREAGIYWRL